MTPYEIFAQMNSAQASHIFEYLFENEKPLYKAAIDNLAKQRKLRPVFIERKPRKERFEWLKSAAGRKANDGVAAHLLQIWLVGEHSALLCDFLDALGIEHDDNGTVDSLPEAPEKEDLQKAIDGLLEKYDADTVAIYLHAFQALDDEGGWPALTGILEEDVRLTQVFNSAD
jgi:hypothetical protein